MLTVSVAPSISTGVVTTERMLARTSSGPSSSTVAGLATLPTLSYPCSRIPYRLHQDRHRTAALFNHDGGRHPRWQDRHLRDRLSGGIERRRHEIGGEIVAMLADIDRKHHPRHVVD